jgi:hypothetical protein
VDNLGPAIDGDRCSGRVTFRLPVLRGPTVADTTVLRALVAGLPALGRLQMRVVTGREPHEGYGRVAAASDPLRLHHRSWPSRLPTPAQAAARAWTAGRSPRPAGAVGLPCRRGWRPVGSAMVGPHSAATIPRGEWPTTDGRGVDRDDLVIVAMDDPGHVSGISA